MPSETATARRVVDPRLSALSGGLSAAIASISTHPLDVVRTKLAVQRSIHSSDHLPRYRGTIGTLRRIFYDEGVRGLFRGLAPAVASHSPAGAMFFCTYAFVKGRLPDEFGAPLLAPDIARSSLAAGTGWACTCLALNPLFVLKTKQQTQLVRTSPRAPLKYTGLVSSLRVVLAEHGIRGLYVGLSAAIAASPGAMIQMPLYEFLKRPTDANQPPSHSQVVTASACAASCVGIVMHPLEVVRLRLQAQGPSGSAGTEYRGIVDCFRKILFNEGMRSFYKGMGTGLIRTVPQSAIGLSCYETILRAATALADVWKR